MNSKQPQDESVQIDLTGQTAVIFGAARGIGRAVADGFARSGCRVVGADKQFDADSDIEFESITADVTSDAQVAEVAKAHPDTDHVVYCVGAGSGHFGFPFWNVPNGSWGTVLEINLISAVRVAASFAPRLSERRCGSLTFFTSVAGQIGSQTDPPYSASKAGLINFMQCVAKDLAPFGVRANAISPGMVRTDLNRSVWQSGQQLLPEGERVEYDTWAEEKIRTVSPLGRWQTPAEFAAMAVYLASEHAANITGQTLNIDGGWVMHS